MGQTVTVAPESTAATTGEKQQFPQLYYSPIMGMMENPFAGQPVLVPAFMGGYFELYT